jgi:triacylglycerol lipase
MNYTNLFSGPWKTIGDDTQYRIVETDYEFIIVFQGSNSKADWKNNFKFRKKPYKNMPVPYSVHRGFLHVWKLINDYFLNLVREIEKPIVIVGHSYGGAIATLCMEDIWFKFPDKREKLTLVTYGSPRILSWRNHSKIKERWENSYIYENKIDLVSHIPFFLMGYVHVKKKIKLKNENKFKIFNNHNLQEYNKNL